MSRLMRPLAVLMLITAALQAQQAPASYEEQYQKGRQLLARREYFDALKAFQRANQLAGGKSAELSALDSQIDALQKKLDSLKTEGAAAQFGDSGNPLGAGGNDPARRAR